jgi:hypothetical protein
MKTNPFTITSFAWQKDIEDRFAAVGEPADSEEVILARLTALATFLESNDLTTKPLTAASRVSRDFALRSDDLTEMGLKLIRKGYEKWRKQAKTPDDIRPLEKALAQLRAGDKGVSQK